MPEIPFTDPDNGAVIAFGENDLAIAGDLSFLAAMEWRIGPPVVIYVTGSATVGMDFDRYRYFDTTNNVVWTEWDNQLDYSLDLGSDFGIQFTLPEGPFITVSGNLPTLLSATTGDNYFTFDANPSSPGGESAGITADKDTANGQGFTVTIDVTIRR